MTTSQPPTDEQRAFWNAWNASTREHSLGEVSRRQREVALGWLEAMGREDLTIIDFGCGSGWLCEDLRGYGAVTGVDLSDEVLERARKRMPDVTFVAGDIMTMELGESAFDVVVTLEVLSHIADQPAFVQRLARLLKPGGALMLATQNRPILRRNADVPPAQPGQLRHWVDSGELRRLLAPHFRIKRLRSLTPRGHNGFLRYVNSYKLAAALRALRLEGAAEHLKEQLGLGWTLMVLAEKRAPMRADG